MNRGKESSPLCKSWRDVRKGEGRACCRNVRQVDLFISACHRCSAGDKDRARQNSRDRCDLRPESKRQIA